MEYTKGPWMVKRLLVTNEDGSIEIADTWNLLGDYPSKSEAVANTKLIAAAPELLEACRAFIELFRESDMRPEGECHELYEKINAAIQKATL